MFRIALLSAVCLASLATGVAAHDEHATEDEPSGDFYAFPVMDTWRGEVIPDSLLHPPYTADPLRPTMALTRVFATSSGIPKTSDSRNYIRIGARLPLLRFSPSGDRDAGIQLDVELGWMAMFDLEKRQDSIAWDGVYGFLLSAADGRGLSAQFGIKHDSSHPGDELLIRTDWERLGYTRQELIGEPVETLMPERFRDGHVGDRNAYAQKPHVRPMGLGLELFGMRKDGQEFPIEISLAPYHSPDGPLVVAAVRDVTGRK